MSASASPLPNLRLLSRLAVGFLLEQITIGRGSHDLVDALIILAVVQANVSPIASDGALQRLYSDYDHPPPDDLRRPVTVHALAQSLRLPYETVRRRVGRLEAAGALELAPQGLYVSAAALSTPEHKAVMLACYASTRNFYAQLRRAGVAPVLSPETLPASPPAEPVRAASRVSSEYVLRVVDLLIAHFNDVGHGVVFLGVLRANTEELSDAERGAEEAGPAGFVPDRLRRPVRTAALAARLGFAPETVRRHAARLVEDGYCVRSAEGLVVPSGVLARPRMVGLMGENHAYLRRMFEGLARAGVLAEWERLERLEATAA